MEAFAKIFEYHDLQNVDSFFVDARQFFTQIKKISEDATLPELDWNVRWDHCDAIVCFDLEFTFTSKDSKFIGTDSITSSTEITPTTISNEFVIPSFNWSSPGLIINMTDHRFREIFLYKNSYISFENVTVAFSCDYHFVPEVGIQLDNFTIYFNPRKIRGGVQEYEAWDFEGNLLDKQRVDPDEDPIDAFMRTSWNTYKIRYTSGLQFSLNCFLSNGRSSPKCLDADDSYDGKYYQLLNMGLIQTLGLGALLSK